MGGLLEFFFVGEDDLEVEVVDFFGETDDCLELLELELALAFDFALLVLALLDFRGC